MSTHFPTQNFGHYQNFLNAQLHAALQGNPAAGAGSLQRLQQLFQLDQMGGGGRPQLPMPNSQVPMCGCMPPPQVSHSSAPAGRGLATGEAGWPANTVTTAGGYHVVPEGKDAAWKIYSPGQQPGETANTRIWGDPHVNEKDGTRWDFTKNSDFVLGDGTRIGVNTTSQTGQSVTASLDITNGADHVRVDGINNNRPQTSGVMNDGYEFRAQHVASNPGRDTFHLGGDKDNVHWTRERNGQIDGVVTGAHYDQGKQGYEQSVDPTLRATVGRDLRPDPWTNPRAWGNMRRDQAIDQFAKLGLGPDASLGFAFATHADHLRGAFQQDVQDLFSGQFNQFQMMVGLMQSESTWQQQMFRAQAGFLG